MRKYEMISKHDVLLSLLEAHNAQLIKYEYYRKIFGNYVIKIQYKDKIYNLVTDRGEICLDSILVHDNSYLKVGHGDQVFLKLLQVIEEKLYNS